jgi:hypothetical protein
MNISKKFKFNFDDGEEKRLELEKEFEKRKKEAEKELDKAADIVDDINDDDYKKPEFKDGSGKKIKFVTEKLHLDESDLDEAIPRDLAKSYRYANNYHRGRYDNYDLQNANYTEITPEDAYKQIKAGNAKDIRLLVDGQLITLRDNGYGDLENRNKYINRDKQYIKKNGDVIRDTAHLPIKHMLSVANKIYLTDENKVEKDPILKDERSKNIESPNFVNRRDNPDLDYNYANYLNKPERAFNSYYSDFEDAKKRIDQLGIQLKNGDISKEDYDQLVSRIKNGWSYRNGLQKQREYKNRRARARYGRSEMDLQAPFVSYDNLKHKLSRTEYDVNSAQEKINKIKSNGSYQNQRYKANLASYEADLENLLLKIANMKMKLRYANEDDEEALADANDELNKATDEFNKTQSELDKLLRKVPSDESYQPWGDATEFYNKIKKNNLTEDFKDLIDTLYPQGLSESRLNDLLSYKQNMITEMLDMEEEDEE